MSMNGERRLELERARLEQVRLGQVRDECTAIIDRCEGALRGVTDVAVQQHLGAPAQQFAAAVHRARATMRDAPDAALVSVQGALVRLQREIAQAEAAAKRWSDAQAEMIARIRTAQAGLASAGGTLEPGAEHAIEQATRGDLAAAAAAAERLEQQIPGARANVLDERVRREVVRGLVSTLKKMGFLAVTPRLQSDVVVLEGRLASGRKARFEIDLEGRMAFDLDGYEGRACAQDMEKVETLMRDEFGVRLGPPQVIWKNPDRLTQGARPLPTNTSRKES